MRETPENEYSVKLAKEAILHLRYLGFTGNKAEKELHLAHGSFRPERSGGKTSKPNKDSHIARYSWRMRRSSSSIKKRWRDLDT